MIATLEEELGCCYSRGRHGAHLTPVGRVIEHARSVLQLLEMMVKKRIWKRFTWRSVRPAFAAATHVLPPVIARFRTSFPAIAEYH